MYQCRYVGMKIPKLP